MSRRNASCRRATSAFCAATLALFSSSISSAMVSTASRRGTTSRRRNPALRRIFSAGVQSNNGSNVCQYSSSLARRLVIRSSRPISFSSSASVAMLASRNSVSCSRYPGPRSRATSSR